jgi:hypothetical protein
MERSRGFAPPWSRADAHGPGCAPWCPRSSCLRRRSTRHGIPSVAMLMTVVVLLVGGLNAASASASLYCSPYGEHAYGEACLFGSFHGVAGTIQSAELSSGSTGFVTNDMWIVESKSEPHWVEAGITDGESTGGSRKLFWADDRPGSGFYQHLGGSASLETAYGDKIYYKGSENWSAEIGGFGGTSTSNSMSPNLIRTGTEETPQAAANVCSEQYNLEWLEPSTNKWHSGWTNGKEASLSQSEPPRILWVNTNHWARDRTNKPECYGL